jgi:hypothetical protein
MEIVHFHTLWNVVLQIVCAPTTVIYAPLLCTITGLVWFIYSECIIFAEGIPVFDLYNMYRNSLMGNFRGILKVLN